MSEAALIPLQPFTREATVHRIRDNPSSATHADIVINGVARVVIRHAGESYEDFTKRIVTAIATGKMPKDAVKTYRPWGKSRKAERAAKRYRDAQATGSG